MPSAVVLLSGGLDSAVTAAMARSRGFTLHALLIDYGQRHRFELDAARKVAMSLGVARHIVTKVDLSQIGGSALTADIDVPKDRSEESMAAGIPITYVPARNTIMLSVALGYAETLAAADLFVGVNAVDYSGYPDCRPEYLAAFEKLANLATKAGVEGTLKFTVHAADLTDEGGDHPPRHRVGRRFFIDPQLLRSRPVGPACRRCDSCHLRAKGFAEAGVPDPTVYVKE